MPRDLPAAHSRRPIRCAIYTRQPVHSSDDLSSCQVQHDACRLYAESQIAHGWTLIPERFDDDGYSGATLERPALDRLLGLVRKGQVDQVIVHRLDRLSRSVRGCAALLNEFRQLEIGLVIVTATELGHSAQDVFVLNILASFAEFEREMIATRIAESRERLKARHLRFAGGVPFGYALRRALQDHPDLDGVDYDLLVVDEYQDLNACDLDLLHLIADRGCAIMGAGDDDQSIYSFRRAAPEGIRRFPEDYPGCADYPLSITQRCGARIIEWASYVIEGDLGRPAGRPRLTAIAGSPPGEVALLAFDRETSEAQGVAALIQSLNFRGVLPEEILVLVRGDHNGAFSGPIKEALDVLGIPFSDPEAVERLLGEPANRRMLATFRLLVHRSDSLAWATLILLAPGIGQKFCDHIYERAREERIRFGEALIRGFGAGFPGVCETREASASPGHFWPVYLSA